MQCLRARIHYLIFVKRSKCVVPVAPIRARSAGRGHYEVACVVAVYGQRKALGDLRIKPCAHSLVLHREASPLHGFPQRSLLVGHCLQLDASFLFTVAHDLLYRPPGIRAAHRHGHGSDCWSELGCPGGGRRRESPGVPICPRDRCHRPCAAAFVGHRGVLLSATRVVSYLLLAGGCRANTVRSLPPRRRFASPTARPSARRVR